MWPAWGLILIAMDYNEDNIASTIKITLPAWEAEKTDLKAGS